MKTKKELIVKEKTKRLFILQQIQSTFYLNEIEIKLRTDYYAI